MARVFVAECKQEVSTFNPVPSHFADFRVRTGKALLEYHRTVREEVGGALEEFEQRRDLEIVAGLGCSSITSGGVLAAESYADLKRRFVENLPQAGSVDAVYLSLHGAMQAEGEHDPEGDLLAVVREVLGPEIPVVVSLDLHGIATDRMLTHVDAVVIYHTYPHVDFYETGARAARLLCDILDHGLRPVTARVKIPALVRGNELVTETGLVRQCIEMAQAVEASREGLAAGLMWGNPFTDVPELRTNSIVVMKDDEDAGIRHAQAMAETFWQHRRKMQVELTSLNDSLRQAAEVSTGTVALVDAADATSSGASGDSNAIVAEARRQGYPGRILAPVVDAGAVQAAFAAGVGATVETTVGGALDPARYTPLPITARVRSLSDGKFRSESFGWPWDSGPTAVLEDESLTLVVGTRPVSLFDRSWFYANGQNPEHFDAVVVKSPHCEPHMFTDWCAKTIDVDAPGATSANLPSLGHVNCARPLFPMEDDAEFTGEVAVFRRGK